jgi:hypothetical protein
MMSLKEEDLQQDTRRLGLEPILNLNKSIRLVAVLSRDGKIVDSITRPGYVSLEPENVTSGKFTKAAIGMGMLEGNEIYLGQMKALIIIREKVTTIIVPEANRIFIASADPDFPITEAENVRLAIQKLTAA